MALVLGGCALDAERPSGQFRVDPTAGPASLLRYAASLGRMTPPELEQERQALELAYVGGGGAGERLQLALLLREPRAPGRDLGRSRRLLTAELGAGGADAAAQDLAAFVLRLLDQEEADAAELRAAERTALEAEQRVTSLERAVEALRAGLAHERGRRAVLERQVEALKAIEHQINRRTRPDAAPETPGR